MGSVCKRVGLVHCLSYHYHKRERVGDNISIAWEPLTVFSDAKGDVVHGVHPFLFQSHCCLVRVLMHSHPSEVVLSVIDNVQAPACKQPQIMSTQGVMMATMCSRRLFVAQN
jgi:hypothetical protein